MQCTILLKTLSIAGMLAVAAFGGPVLGKSNSVEPPARMQMGYDGPILVTPAGRTLYLTTSENIKNPKFTWRCTSERPKDIDDQQSGIGPRPQLGFQLVKSCVDKFPPYIADPDATPTREFTIAQRPDGTRQWAYRGHPLYTSIRDRAPGDRNGLGASGLFGAAFRGGMGFAWADIELPRGLKLLRREEGLILASDPGDKPIHTLRKGVKLVKAGAAQADFKPLLAPAIGTVAGEWSIIQAGAGVNQYAFRGRPLYRAPAGMHESEIMKLGDWEPLVVEKGPKRPAAVSKQLTLLGEVYADAEGMTLYTYSCNAGRFGPGGGVTISCDDPGDPAQYMVSLCGDGKECARRWRPYLATPNAKPEGDFTIVDITYPMFTDMRGGLYPSDAPRVRAWAYRGKPLFTYFEDEQPGDIWGDGHKGLWGSNFSALQVPGRTAIYPGE